MSGRGHGEPRGREPRDGRVPGERLYRALLRLHPSSFRRRHEAELVGCLRDAWRADVRGRGRLAGLRFWSRMILGTLVTAARQRFGGSPSRGATTRPGRSSGAGAGAGREALSSITGSGGLGRRLEVLGQDARYAVRTLRRSPGFAAAVLLTLGLSIGGAAAVFTLVHGVLLRPLPYPDADRLYRVGHWVSAPNYRDMKEGLGSFAVMGAYTPDGANMLVEGEPARVSVAEADAEFFRALGVRPLLGRTFTEPERAAAAPVAVISHDLWLERMGGRPDAIGKTLVLGGVAREVIGVLPRGLMVPAGTDVWTPLILERPEWRTRRGISWIQVVGRLRPDASVATLEAEAAILAGSLRDAHPDTNRNFEIGLRTLEEATVGPVRTELRLLLGAVALVLLVAAINVGGLLLARRMARREEVAVREALGGGRRRLAVQLLTENAVLAGLGCVLGLAFGRAALAALLAVAPPGTPRLGEIAPGLPTLLFVLGAGAVAALVLTALTTLAPIRGGAAALRAGRTGGSRRAGRLRGGVVVAQVALALGLLFAAGLLGKSFWRLQHVDLGFDPRGVLVAGLPIDDTDFTTAEAREAHYGAILERARNLAGVQEAALTSSAPFTGFGVVFDYDIPDANRDPRAERLSRFRIVTPELFSVLGLPLLQGRPFDLEAGPGGGLDRGRARAGGREAGHPGAVVSEDLVRREFPDRDPLGQRLVTAGDTFRITGVVPSIRDVTAREPSPFPFVYVPVMPATRQSMTLVVKTTGDPGSLAEPLRRAIHDVAPAQPVTPLRALPQLVAESAARSRFTLVLLVFFAATTLLLAAVGLYGTLAYAVGRRTREIGVRVALGAPARRVRALVLRQALGLAALGATLGLLLGLWGVRFLEALLFQVDAYDPAVFAAGAATLLAVAFVAAWIPARRATRVSPVQALRAD